MNGFITFHAGKAFQWCHPWFRHICPLSMTNFDERGDDEDGVNGYERDVKKIGKSRLKSHKAHLECMDRSGSNDCTTFSGQ